MTTLDRPVTSGQAVGRSSGRTRPATRALLAVPAVACLVLGLDGALTLLDVWSPAPAARTGSAHGLLMTLGFVGALIALERVAALRHPLGYAAPVSLAVGALLHLGSPTERLGSVLLVVGTVVLVVVYRQLWRRQRDDAVLVQALGAVLAVGGAIGWLGGVPVSAIVPWLAGFLVLTIAGERLELARLGMPASAGALLVLGAAGVASSALALLLWPVAGPLFGLALALIAGWLVRHDVARNTVRSAGLPRYMAISMITGQAWLGVAAGVWLLGDPSAAGPAYDAAVHAVFLGFTMSMVMAHAPVLLPVVARVRLPFHPALYVPLSLLQLGLVIRLWPGDALGITWAWQVGGVVTVLALVAFMACVVMLVATSGRRTP